MGKPAVFLDRDGVINVDTGYVQDKESFEFIPGVFKACHQLKAQGYLLVIVTNQSGIARGYFTEETFLSLTEWMDWNFEDQEVLIDGIYYCPHHATQGIGNYKKTCDCRKPAPGMFLQAAQDLDIDLSKSIMVGDKADDMRAAQAAGIPTSFLVRTGKEITDEGRSLATAVLDNLTALPQLLLQS